MAEEMQTTGKAWLEISVCVDGEAAEAVSELLNTYGRGGAVIEHRVAGGPGAHDDVDEMRVKAYIPAEDEALKRRIEEALWHLGQLYPIADPEFTVLGEADWAEAWKAHYGVLHVGQHTAIVPAWQSYDPASDEVVIVLDPGMAFGTGTHPTTRLCLAALEELIVPGMRVLDLGTGSGILSIAAAKRGASSVYAVDIDPIAVSSARENVAANGVADVIHVERGSLERARATYDLVLVNILYGVILDLLDRGLADVLRPNGIVLVSGIVDDQEADIANALVARGIEVTERRRERDWVAVVGRRAT